MFKETFSFFTVNTIPEDFRGKLFTGEFREPLLLGTMRIDLVERTSVKGPAKM